jgi:hypothetical protein
MDNPVAKILLSTLEWISFRTSPYKTVPKYASNTMPTMITSILTMRSL